MAWKDCPGPSRIAAPVCTAILAGGCDEKIGYYLPASSMYDRHGLAHDRERALELNGQQIRIWGHVDSSNVYPEMSIPSQQVKMFPPVGTRCTPATPEPTF